MADFDPAIALQARGYSPQDAVAPLQAYMLAQQGNNLGAETTSRDIANQLAQATLSSKQQFAKTMATPGANVLAGLNSSGLGAFDPDAASKALGNIQSTNTLGAYSKYGQTNDPSSLAPAGPAAVREGYGASDAEQDVLAKQTNLRGQIALGYMTAVAQAQTQAERDLAWNNAVGQASSGGLIKGLQTLHAIENIRDSGQRMTIAKLWAGAGAGSVVNSGDAAGNTARQTTLNTPIVTSPGQSVWTSSQLRDAINGQTPTTSVAARTVGRSAATGGPTPAPTSPLGNGDQPNGGGQAQGGGVQSPSPLMAQTENRYGLPTNYLTRTAQIESGGRANASNPSGASGLFQFMPSTWAKYGAPGTSPLNPQAATEAAARLAADNSAILTRSLGRQPTAAELYLAHQQGPGGAAALLANPSVPAASIVGAKAVIANGGTPNMTAGQFAAMWENKFNRAGNSGNFSLSGPSPMGQGVSMPAAEPAPTLPNAGGTGLRAAAGIAPPSAPQQPDLAPPVSGPVPLPTSTQPMPSAPGGAPMGRSASDAAPVPPTRQLSGNSGLTPLVQGMTPFQLHKQELDAVRAVDEERGARDQFVAANTAQTGLLQLSEDLSKLDPKNMTNLRDTFLSAGTGAETRIGFAKAVNSALATAGMAPLFDQDKIAQAESAYKISGRLGFDLAGGMGGGHSTAGYIVNEAIGLNPGVMNTPQGAKLLIGSLLATQQRQKDFYAFQRQYAENNAGNPIGAETEFDVNRPPMTYVQDAQRLANVPLRSWKLLQEHSNNPAAIATFNKVYGSGLARYFIGSRTDY